MNWINLTSIEQVNEVVEASATTPVLILKHSTRCSISAMALNRLESSWDETKTSILTYYLDLIAHRDISNFLAEKFNVYHQSPQVLLIKNGESYYDESHMGIRYDEIVEQLASN